MAQPQERTEKEASSRESEGSSAEQAAILAAKTWGNESLRKAGSNDIACCLQTTRGEWQGLWVRLRNDTHRAVDEEARKRGVEETGGVGGEGAPRETACEWRETVPAADAAAEKRRMADRALLRCHQRQRRRHARLAGGDQQVQLRPRDQVPAQLRRRRNRKTRVADRLEEDRQNRVVLHKLDARNHLYADHMEPLAALVRNTGVLGLLPINPTSIFHLLA